MSMLGFSSSLRVHGNHMASVDYSIRNVYVVAYSEGLNYSVICTGCKFGKAKGVKSKEPGFNHGDQSNG